MRPIQIEEVKSIAMQGIFALKIQVKFIFSKLEEKTIILASLIVMLR